MRKSIDDIPNTLHARITHELNLKIVNQNQISAAILKFVGHLRNFGLIKFANLCIIKLIRL